MGRWEKGGLRKRRPEAVVLAEKDGSLPQRHRGKAKTESADKCICRVSGRPGNGRETLL